MLSYKNYSCFLPGFKSCYKFVLGPNMGPMCVRGGWGWWGGAHHKNQLNVLPFSVQN